MPVKRAAGLAVSYIVLAAAMNYFVRKEPWDYREIAIAFDRARPSPAILPIVLDMQSIAKSGTATSYQLSAALRADSFIVQRSTEFLYPVRIVSTGAPIFAANANELPASCKLLTKRETVSAYDCQ